MRSEVPRNSSAMNGMTDEPTWWMQVTSHDIWSSDSPSSSGGQSLRMQPDEITCSLCVIVRLQLNYKVYRKRQKHNLRRTKIVQVIYVNGSSKNRMYIRHIIMFPCIREHSTRAEGKSHTQSAMRVARNALARFWCGQSPYRACKLSIRCTT